MSSGRWLCRITFSLLADGPANRTVSLPLNSQATVHNLRSVTVQNLGIATEMAGVDMRLEKGAIRELHWHTQSEACDLTYFSYACVI